MTISQIAVAKVGPGCATSEYLVTGHMLAYTRPHSYSACIITYPPDAFLSLMNLHILNLDFKIFFVKIIPVFLKFCP